jgi:hypothetical protein
MIKQFLILVVLLVGFLPLSAQNKFSVSGTLTDAQTGETLIGANVSVANMSGTGVSSNEYGFYSITLPEGQHTLVFSYLGYESVDSLVNLKANLRIDMKMGGGAENIEEIVVTAEARNEQVTSIEMGVEKLDMKEIKKIPVLFGEQDILKTLQLTPGVKSLGEGSGGLFVRGGDNSQNLILLDEATVYNANHLLGFFSTFNSDAIKDVSLYKGTAAANYGGRLASVIDVKMNEGNNQKYHIGGGIGLISSRLFVEGPIVKDKGSFIVAARRTYADLFLKLSSDETINQNTLYFYDINVKANYKINDKNRIYLSGYFGRDVLGFNDRFGIDWGNITGTLRWNSIWNDKLFSNTSLVYSDYDYRVEITRTDDEFSLTSIIKALNLKHEFQYYLNNDHKFKFGFQATHHTITPGQVEVSEGSDFNPIELQDRYALESALFFSHNWRINSKLNVEYGLRLSSFSQFGAGDFYSFDSDGNVTDTTSYDAFELVKNYINPEPRINVSYVFDKNHSIKASFTRNVQNLHLITNSTSSTPTDIWIASGKNVKPEIGDQLSLGYFQNFMDDKLQLSAEVYYKWMYNQVDLRNGAEIRANELLEGELLSGNGRAYGLELMLRKKYGKLSGWIGYTISRTERKIEGINSFDWYPARQDITHDLSVVGVYDINNKWSISATFVYNTGSAVTFPSGKYELNGQVQYYYTERNGYRMPDYHRLDLGATRYFVKNKKMESSLNFSMYNTYGRKNAYTIDFQEDPDDPTKTQAVKTYLFTFVPSLTYNFKF